MADLKVNICGITLKNPVIAASGTFGFGREFSEYFDISKLGAIAVKGITLEPREGNLPPRIAETPSGILNSVGLQNPGVQKFISNEIPFLKQFALPIIVNIAGNSAEDYVKLVEILNDVDEVHAIELNVSCPNVKKGCLAFGTTKEGVYELTKEVKKYCKKPLIVKLSPNVSNISEIAVAAESAGADAISLINTILGMAIDIHKRKPILHNNFGGLSGPAVKPIALRMVFEVSNAVKIPVIGMGGISSGNDAVEFMLAGASAVMVGTYNFVKPTASIDVIEGIESYLEMYKIEKVYDIIGKLILNG